MNIECGKYTICSDKYCLWINETVKPRKKDAQPYENLVAGYCSNFQELLEDFVERKMRGSAAKTVEKLLKEFSGIERDAKKIAKTINATRKELQNVGE